MTLYTRCRKAQFVSSLLAASIALSACGSSNPNDLNHSDGGTSGPERDAKPQEVNLDESQVELVFHSNNGDSPEAFDNLFGHALRKKFPNYTIKYIQSKEGQKLDQLLVQNQAVDVLYASLPYIFGLMMDYKLEYDMSGLVQEQGIDLNQFEPTLIDGIKLSGQGNLVALPVTNMVQVLFYNKSIFNQFGVPYPKDGMTWDETMDIAAKLTRKEGEKQFLGFAASPAHMFRGNQYSQPYLDPAGQKATFSGGVWNKLIQTYFIAPGVDAGYQAKALELKRLPNIRNFVDSQELAMFVYNSQTPFTTLTMKNVDWDLVSLPVFPDKPKLGSAATPFTMAVTSISKHKAEALNAVHYLASKQSQLELSQRGIMSVIRDAEVKAAYGQQSEYKDKNWKAVYHNDYAPLPIYSKDHLKVEALMNQVPFEAVTGAKDLNTALREAEEKADKLLKENAQ